MANLMNGNAALIDGEQESNKTIKQYSNNNSEYETENLHSEKPESNKTIELPKNKAIMQDGNKEIIEMKEKATFNLSLSTLETLEDAWIKLKRQFKGEQRITKTAIVEMALEICIEDLEKRKSESSLYKRLADLRSASKSNDNSLT
jgi:uncharacterized tellurite resistance protein B-like protein